MIKFWAYNIRYFMASFPLFLSCENVLLLLELLTQSGWCTSIDLHNNTHAHRLHVHHNCWRQNHGVFCLQEQGVGNLERNRRDGDCQVGSGSLPSFVLDNCLCLHMQGHSLFWQGGTALLFTSRGLHFEMKRGIER